MLNPIEIKFKLDKTIKRALTTELMIKSHDINVIEFHISFDGLELTADHTVKVLSVFNDTKSQTNVNCDIADGKAIYRPDTSLISQLEYVQNYVYVYHGNQSLDVRLFTYSVGLSQIDKTALKVKTVYDQSYADLLADFEQALQDYKNSLPQASDLRAEVDVILNKFKVDSDAKLSQYDADAQRVIADNQTAFDLAESNRQSTYEQAEDNRNQASEQAVVDWNMTADAILETVESNESARVDAEATRKTAETDRVSSEATRKSSETTRVSNESERESAEDIRLANEVERVTAENIRSEFYDGFNGRLGDLESGRVVLKNLVVNGDFSDGVTGWIGTFGASTVDLSVANKILSAPIIKNSPMGGVRQNTDATYTSGDKIYQKVRYRVTNDDCLTIRFSNGGIVSGGATDIVNSSVSENVWYEQSHLHTLRTGSGYLFLQILHYYVDIETAKNKVLETDYIMGINLTQIFGVGNEPTKAEMDELIKITGYFDEITLTHKQLLNWQLKLMRQNRNALIALGGTII